MIAEQTKLHRKRFSAHRGVYAVAELTEYAARRQIELRPLNRNHRSNRYRALLFVGFECAAPKDFGQLAADKASQQIHLKETIGPFNVALGEEEVAVAGGDDVRHTA